MFNFLRNWRNWLNRRKCAMAGKHTWNRDYHEEMGGVWLKSCKVCAHVALVKRRVRKGAV